MNGEELEAAFRGIFVHLFEQTQPERGACAVAIDGKAQKGRLKFEEEKSYPVHAVSLVEHETGIVLMQGHVERGDTEAKERPTDEETKGEPTEQKPGKKGKPKGKPGELTEQEQEREQEEKKQRSELAVAYRLMAHIDWKGKVLTGDALYCQRCLCAAILLAGGDYMFLVKGHQPHLLEEICLLFAPPAPAKRAGEGILRLAEQQAQRDRKSVV